MRKTTLNLPVMALLLLFGTSAMGEQCKGLQALNLKSRSSAWDRVVAAFSSDVSKPVECGSLVSVLDSVANTHKVGGRKLEEDRPFNPQQAQANLAEAQKDPAVRKRLEQLRKDVPDATQRLIYEAATFDEEGYYGARDLRINQLQQQLK
ncbi:MULTISPECIES: hypothetical protein [Pseudomonas]|jgi:hypothetical protein|uniref:Lipoprotein n=1 Tax=Pseudomonas fluorescens TaxID=294 RepID=A0A5E7T8W6_PSEFL|nr:MULTISPECIES: hypothetical protein [Pseudomonas]QCY11764.1 hypothetical protein ELQ88_13725 [Pseudomonas sp. MPC6]VVP94578.1 hypothetical protein PS928_01980 [Pseudomonas fluorescens]